MPGIKGPQIAIYETLYTQLKCTIENDDLFGRLFFLAGLGLSLCPFFSFHCVKIINIEPCLTTRQPEYRQITINHLSN